MGFIEDQKWRYATKKFDANRKVSNADLSVLKEAINLAATSYGLQLFKVLLVENKEKIDVLNNKLNVLDQERLIAHDDLISPEELGIQDRLKILYTIVFLQRNPLGIALFVGYFLLFLFLEMTNLITLWKHRDHEFKWYLEEQKRRNDLAKTKADLKAKKEFEEESEKLEIQKSQEALARQLADKEKKANMIADSENKRADIVIKKIQNNSLHKIKLTDEEHKLFKRKSIDAHLNGVGKSESEKEGS